VSNCSGASGVAADNKTKAGGTTTRYGAPFLSLRLNCTIYAACDMECGMMDVLL
jgi:hypothetical protein